MVWGMIGNVTNPLKPLFLTLAPVFSSETFKISQETNPKYSWGQRFREISKSQKLENRRRRLPENARDWPDKI